MFRRVVIELRRRGHHVEVVEMQRRHAPAVTGLASAYGARRAIATADTVHLELGSNDIEVFWFALGAVLMRRDCVVIAHDYPQLAHVPAAGMLPTSSRWSRALAYRVLSPALDRLLVRTVVRRSAVLVVFGEQARRGWLARGAAHVEIIAHGSDPPAADAVSPSSGESVLFAGFIGPRKGVDILLEAWRRVGPLIDVPLLLAGAPGTADDAWLHELQRTASTMTNPPRFLGDIPDEVAFQSLINRAAIVVLPYRSSSPASGVLIRAMSAGRPVIATLVPAASAIVDGDNAVLVPRGDPQALAEAIRDLWRSPWQRDRLGREAARTAARLFSWRCHVAGLERAYAAARGGITRR